MQDRVPPAPGLPEGLAWRPMTRADTATVTSVVAALDEAHLAQPDVTEPQVAALLGERTVDLPARSWLVLDRSPGREEAVAAGLLLVDVETGEAELDVHHRPGAGRAEPAVRWVLRQGVRAWRAGASGMPVYAGTHQGDGLLARALGEAGFTVVREFWRMGLVLPEALPPVAVPAGYTVRPVTGDEADLREVHRVTDEAFADHWEHHPIAFDLWWQDQRAQPGFDVGLWHVAESAPGSVAAALLGSHRMADLGIGYVNDLAVLRPHRRRGLGAALLRTAMLDAAGAGYSALRLNVDATNPTGATHLYESVGMRRQARYTIFRLQDPQTPGRGAD